METSTRPRVAIVLLVAWVLIQTTRLGAFTLAQSVLAGAEADAWLFPAFVDVFVGITAPFLAFALWKKTGLGVWVAALIWFAISLMDHFDAITAAFVTASNIPQSLGGTLVQALTVLLLLTLIDIIAVFALTGRKLKSYYLAPRS